MGYVLGVASGLTFWSIILIGILIYKKVHKTIDSISLYIVSLVIGLALPWIAIMIVLTHQSCNSYFNSFVYMTLIAYGLNALINLIIMVFLYVKHMFSNIKVRYIVIGFIVLYIILVIAGIVFKEMVSSFDVSSPFKFVGLIAAIYSLAYSIVDYYSNHYAYELTDKNDDCSSKVTIKEKEFTLKFNNLLIEDVGLVYTIITVVWMSNVNSAFRFGIENYNIGIRNIFSPNLLTIIDMALVVFAISLFIAILVIIIIRACVRKYYKYHGDAN